ncbi:Hint domain-containing protein [Lutimaribacter sp. EGI FJ00015]|uniref:Hint domain-containing protein n=1 Tax=Lutimaribacter degradans TaxID=2945989 RepID=A0ACC5ZWF8_9RHOB|nr:Hint domain-containing protein [Lutimaribacter sp. EGI FJ00013]MCM2562646.1 Hint domain-containing protein [Lutimaribacter sp. EGI FJ00013]MCO0613803.1 Hint domain-containing protein [Lutimaribacter sp. EGI FJ00015]MCO0636714.1 Hint domain-containing protein [Lutimaribacter sp. EGI FJ00014]
MGTGFGGTFVISWSQTEVDGLVAAPVESLSVGAAWAWRGEAVRVDGPGDVLRLEQADGEDNVRRRAAHMVRRLVGAAISGQRDLHQVGTPEMSDDSAIVVTDGAQTYTITMIEVGPGASPLLMFLDKIPPRGRDLWVVHHTIDNVTQQNPMGPSSGGVICFTPGTWISTPDGPRLVQDLREGDHVQTRDSGAQEVLWIGSRRMTGARLFAMPKLRPIRIRAGALGIERPDQELIVSPEHRMLVRGRAAQALFNTPEVLVAARDLVNGSTVAVDTNLRQVTYIHLLLPQHQVVWANGVESESFHPANAALSTLAEEDRARLLALHPELEYDPTSYGSYARRNLSRSEAAILQHEAA